MQHDSNFTWIIRQFASKHAHRCKEPSRSERASGIGHTNLALGHTSRRLARFLLTKGNSISCSCMYSTRPLSGFQISQICQNCMNFRGGWKKILKFCIMRYVTQESRVFFWSSTRAYFIFFVLHILLLDRYVVINHVIILFRSIDFREKTYFMFVFKKSLVILEVVW